MDEQSHAVSIFVIKRIVFDLSREIWTQVFRDRFLSDIVAGFHCTIVKLCDNVHAGPAYDPPSIEGRIAKHGRAFKDCFLVEIDLHSGTPLFREASTNTTRAPSQRLRRRWTSDWP